jgi:hypothetical protein
MKKTIRLVIILASILVIACNNQKKTVIENPYIGAWEKTDSKAVYADTTITKMPFGNPVIKLLTNKHYAFGSQAGVNKITGGGGEYTFRGDLFITYPKYHSTSAVVGDSIVWKSKIEGDIWTISFSGKIDTIRVDATEIWKRIRE